jgi:hypothetical protein
MGVNRITVSGILETIGQPRFAQGWTSLHATIGTDSGCSLPLFAKDDAARTLATFRAGDFLLVVGHLSRSPAGALQVSVETVSSFEKKALRCTHHMEIPREVAR